MNTLTKSLLASVALTGLLAGCASYDYDGAYGYSYGYTQPYGYAYDYRPYYYDYGTYYPSYGPAWYGPSVGFDFRYRDRDRSYRGGRRHAGNHSNRSHAGNRGETHPGHTSNGRQPNRATSSRARVPAAPAPQRVQSGHRAVRSAQTASRNDQQ